MPSALKQLKNLHSVPFTAKLGLGGSLVPIHITSVFASLTTYSASLNHIYVSKGNNPCSTVVATSPFISNRELKSL